MPVPTELRLIQQAYRFALDATPAQERAFSSHAGGARYAYNWALESLFSGLDAYNEAVAADIPAADRPKFRSHFDLCKEWTIYKDAHADDPEPPEGERRTNTGWVTQNFVGSYQAAIRDAHGSLTRFLASRRGEVAGRRVGRPRFRSRARSRASFQVHGTTLTVPDAHHVKVPKIGLVKTHEQTRKLLRLLRRGETDCLSCARRGVIPTGPASAARAAVDCPGCGGAGRDGCPVCRRVSETTGEVTFTGRVRPCPTCKGTLRVPFARVVRGTISRDSDDRWYIALTVERMREIRTGPSKRQRDGGPVGLDFGVREIATLSDGRVIRNPRYLEQALLRLARAQQHLSRTRPGSAGHKAAVARVGRLHHRVKSLRLDYLQKATSEIVHGHSLIAMEGFDVRATAESGSKNLPKRVRRNRNRGLLDSGIGISRWQIASKSAFYGATAITVSRSERTGRTCSRCGQERTNPVPPSRELFDCGHCGFSGDRRVNSAQVVLKMGLADLAERARRQSTSPASSAVEAKSGGGGDVSPVAVRPRGRSPVKPQAGARPPGRGKAGTPSG